MNVFKLVLSWLDSDFYETAFFWLEKDEETKSYLAEKALCVRRIRNRSES